MSVAVKIALWTLKRANLTIEDRIALTSAIMGKLNALPAKDIIKYEGGTLYLNDEPVSLDMARVLRESARTIIDNPAKRAVQEQVTYRAINIGVHNAEKPEQLLFSRSAIWNLQQMDELYNILAQTGD